MTSEIKHLSRDALEPASSGKFDSSSNDTKEAPSVSVVILDYMKGKKVFSNVQKLLSNNTKVNIQIIIVDNSCDEVNSQHIKNLGLIDNLKIIISDVNLGYARGCNRGAEYATGDYILILNPDISWNQPNTLESMIDYMERSPKVGLIGPRQVQGETGIVTPTARAFPRIRVQIARRTILKRVLGLKQLVNYDEMRHLDLNKPQRVDWLQSSCILMRRDLWNDIGGFDERFWLFMADPEICWQVWRRGLEVVYYPQTEVEDDGIRCSSGGFFEFFRKWTVRQHLRDSIRFKMLHLGELNPRKKLNA